jgi:hypothetical protein
MAATASAEPSRWTEEVVRKRLQFTIRGMLAVVTIVALAISLYLTHARLRSTEAEVERLRKETGYLTIGDVDQVHLIAVPTTEEMAWRWRVYLPGGHDFVLYAHHGRLDAKGHPESGGLSMCHIGGRSDPWKAREILLDAALGKNPEGEFCLSIRENGQGGACIHFGPSRPDWADGTTMFSERVAGRGTIVSADTTTPLGLIGLDGVNSKGKTSEQAVLLWIGDYRQDKDAMRALKQQGILPRG